MVVADWPDGFALRLDTGCAEDAVPPLTLGFQLQVWPGMLLSLG